MDKLDILETDGRQLNFIWMLFVAVLVLSCVLNQLRPPGGWLALEFPAFFELFNQATPESWTPREREDALFGLGLDFLYLVLYPALLSLVCYRANRVWNLPGWLIPASRLFSGLVLIAAPLDAMENIGLYYLIQGNSSAGLQWFITLVSAPKWGIALGALLVCVLCIAARALRGAKGP